MAIKEQLNKLKENWLLIVIVLVVLGFPNFGGLGNLGSISSMSKDSGYEKTGIQELAYSRFSPIMPPSYGDFAPEITQRMITKSATMTTEVETGSFKNAESMIKSIVTSTNSYLLNQNVNKYDSGSKSYYSGNYQIKVDSKKYDDIAAQLKSIGEVKSFNENSEDITASYKNLNIELEAEKERLSRYNKMYDEAALIADKIQLSDKIFDEERTIKYLEDSLKNVNQQVDYSTIYVTLNEKQPKYANIEFIKFSALVRRLVESISSLLTLIFVIAPYAVAAIILWITVRFFRNRG